MVRESLSRWQPFELEITGEETQAETHPKIKETRRKVPEVAETTLDQATQVLAVVGIVVVISQTLLSAVVTITSVGVRIVGTVLHH